MSLGRVALASILILCASPRSSWADAGDVAIGAELGAACDPAGGRVGAALRLGISDWAAVEGRLGLGVGDGRLAGRAAGGLVGVWDVLTWVPEATLAVGCQIDREQSEPRIIGEVGVRRYVGRRWAIGLAAGAEWGPAAGAFATVRASFWLEP